MPAEVTERLFRELGAAVDAVQHLQRTGSVCVAVGQAASEERDECACFLFVAELKEWLERERRVSDPGVAVVPVATAFDLLRQTRRGSGNDRSGGRVGEEF
jgi:hypothetical protein